MYLLTLEQKLDSEREREWERERKSESDTQASTIREQDEGRVCDGENKEIGSETRFPGSNKFKTKKMGETIMGGEHFF